MKYFSSVQGEQFMTEIYKRKKHSISSR